MTTPRASWMLLTPATSHGAIAIVAVATATPADLDDLLVRALDASDAERDRAGAIALASGASRYPVASVRVRTLAGADRGVVVRVSPTLAHLMPHGGIAIVRALGAALEKLGVRQTSELPARELYPEARSDVEARALHALAHAASPGATDLLLRQHALWLAPGAASDPERDRALNRLLYPPTIVLVGRSNIGKSSLLNALARTDVSLVADEPGTTRDHTGVRLLIPGEGGGLVVHAIDAPGVRDEAGEVEARALAAAWEIAARADLILRCGDAGAPTLADHELPAGVARVACLRVCLRCDRAQNMAPSWPADVRVSAHTGLGLGELAARVREVLVPERYLRAHEPWKFWEESVGGENFQA